MVSAENQKMNGSWLMLSAGSDFQAVKNISITIIAHFVYVIIMDHLTSS